MTAADARRRVSLEMPGAYKVAVQGVLDGSWSDRLGGMTITTETPEGRAPVTTLDGRLLDQAALLGVQVALYELHLPLLSLVRIKDETRSQSS